MAQWCSRCFQKECTRSLHGKSKFEARAQNWESLLFTNVSKLDPNDDRFKEISTKKFLNVLPTLSGAKSAWMDPRDVDSAREYSIPARAPAPPALFLPPEPEIELPPLPEIVPVTRAVELPTPPVEPVEKPTVAPPAPGTPDPVLRNTPARSKQMIGGGEQNAPSPVLDPWQPKQGLKPGETLVKPGSRFRFGS